MLFNHEKRKTRRAGRSTTLAEYNHAFVVTLIGEARGLITLIVPATDASLDKELALVYDKNEKTLRANINVYQETDSR